MTNKMKWKLILVNAWIGFTIIQFRDEDNSICGSLTLEDENVDGWLKYWTGDVEDSRRKYGEESIGKDDKP